MTKEQFEEILDVQKIATDLASPGGFGQVPKQVTEKADNLSLWIFVQEEYI